MKSKLITLSLLSLFFFLPHRLFAQRHAKATVDSLLNVVAQEKDDTNKVNTLVILSNACQVYKAADGVKYGKQAIELAKKTAYPHMEYVYSAIGLNYEVIANYPSALEYDQMALKASEDDKDQKTYNGVINNIGDIYVMLGRYPDAREYLSKALKLFKADNNMEGMIEATTNIGDTYANEGDYNKGLEYFVQAAKYSEQSGENSNIIPLIGNIGAIYGMLKNYTEAYKYYMKGLALSKQFGDKHSTGNISGNLGENYFDMAQDSAYKIPAGTSKKELLNKGIAYLDTALNVSLETNNLQALNYFSSVLSDAYAYAGDYDKALSAFKQHTVYKDSMFNQEKTREITKRELSYQYGRQQDSIKAFSQKKQLELQKQMQLNALTYEYQKKQALAKTEKERQQLLFEEQLKRQQIESNFKQRQAAADALQQRRAVIAKANQEKKDALAAVELKRQKSMAYAAMAGAGLLMFVAVGAGYAYRQKRRDNETIAKEKKRSEDLLLNILPADVAEELKEKGSANARLFDEVTVLFTDFVNFTLTSELLTPQQLVDELHHCFKAFDGIMATHNIEKIKTVGDAYLAVAGLPNADANHAANCIKAAIEIREFVRERKEVVGDKAFDIRIGLHSGNVVAGIVGVKKFAYDIWGDTVNTAARMEQNSIPGKINVSEKTYELTKDQFSFTYRGEITAKNKGALGMYFVEGANAPE